MSEIKLRLERPEDYHEVESITRDAFWGHMNAVCDEHYICHLLRNSPAFIPELDYVAEMDGKIVGNVMYTKAKVVEKDGAEHEILTFGPLSVLPEYQRCGVGRALMCATLLKARELGYGAVAVFGHPDYYPRYGFKVGRFFGIDAGGGRYYDSLMALELRKGALDGIHGTFVEDSGFETEPAEAAEYDKNFPQREPGYMTPIALLLDRLPEESRKGFTDAGIKYMNSLCCYSGREMLGWPGMSREVLTQVNGILREYGFAEKLFPEDRIFTHPVIEF